MNATEDGQPVGEAPELPSVHPAVQLGIAACHAANDWLERSLKYPAGDNVFGSPIQDRRAGAIAEIRALHPWTRDIIAILDKWGV